MRERVKALRERKMDTGLLSLRYTTLEPTLQRGKNNSQYQPKPRLANSNPLPCERGRSFSY